MLDNGWSSTTLGGFVELKYGKSLPSQARVSGPFPVFGSNGQVGSHMKSITAGPTIVIGRKGSFGEVAYSDQACWPIDTTYYVDGTATSADLRWLNWLLPTLGLKELNRAAAIPGLNREDAYRKPVMLPPLDEQRRIADILDQADTLRTKRREAIAHLDDLTQSLFHEMFGEPIASVEAWPVTHLGALVREGDRVNYGVVQPGETVSTGVPLIRAGDLVGGRVDRRSLKTIASEIESKYARSRLLGDEILVSCVGSIGSIAVSDDSLRGCNVARAVARIPLAVQWNRTFVASHLRTPVVQRYFTSELRTVAQPTLNIKQLAATPVPLPPRALQDEFAARAELIEAAKSTNAAHLAELDSLAASLGDRAFAGAL